MTLFAFRLRRGGPFRIYRPIWALIIGPTSTGQSRFQLNDGSGLHPEPFNTCSMSGVAMPEALQDEERPASGLKHLRQRFRSS